MKKLFPLFAIVFLALAIFPFAANARVGSGTDPSFTGVQTQERLIPCGGFEIVNGIRIVQPACGLCDVFGLITNIIKFFLIPGPLNNGFAPVLVIATILIVVGGFLLMTAGGDPTRLQKAKAVLTAVLIGLIIIYASGLLLGTLFKAIGVAEWTTFQNGFVSIRCGAKNFPIPTAQ